MLRWHRCMSKLEFIQYSSKRSPAKLKTQSTLTKNRTNNKTTYKGGDFFLTRYMPRMAITPFDIREQKKSI